MPTFSTPRSFPALLRLVPASRISAAVLLAGLIGAVGCVAPPRPAKPVKTIPPPPLTAMTLPPLDDESTFAGPEALPPVPAGAAVGGTHTVVRGDTLAGLARRYYGNPSAWKRIAEANPQVDPNNLKPGQTLMLP